MRSRSRTTTHDRLKTDASPKATVDEDVTARGTAATTAVTESSVHVDVADLDMLMDLVGELVLARGEIGAARASTTSTARSPRRTASSGSSPASCRTASCTPASRPWDR